jgi:asparagine synthetase B (glutamine-hydrolysing)
MAMSYGIRPILRKEWKKISGSLAIATSNGVDSKALVISAVEDAEYLPTVISLTLDDRESRDFVGARDIANEYDLDFIPVRLPTDAATIERDIVTMIRTHKIFTKTSIESHWGFIYIFDELRRRKINALVTGHGNSHYQNTKNALVGLHQSGYLKSRSPDAVAALQKLRHKAFAKPNEDGLRDVRRMGEAYGVSVFTPWFNAEIFNLFTDKAWIDLNKPKQKYPVRVEFPTLYNNEPQINLQCGDSGIRDLLAEIAIRRWKPTAKNSIAAYNVVAGR